MDKEKSVDPRALCSWMDVHQLLGELISSKGPPELLNAAWGAAALGLKASTPAALHPRRPPVSEGEAAAGSGSRPGATHGREQALNTGKDLPMRSCSCPGCPYSIAASSLEVPTSNSESAASSKDGGSSQCQPDSTVASNSGRNEVTPGPSAAPCRLGTDSEADLRPVPPPSLPACVCCCGAPTPSLSHTHHHFHHHHCALTPCPQLSSSAHPCMHCAASFPRPSQLLQHQRSAHAHRPPGFLCTECGRTFNSHSNLRVHLHVHTGARPYACGDCGKSFSQSGALKVHRRVHTGERPYTCAYCGRGFPNLAGVRAHQRTHTGEKPYRCGHCGRGFTQSGALKIHTRTHTGERPFSCSLCGRGYSNRSGLRFHYRTVHGLTPEASGEQGVRVGCSPGRPRGRTNAGVNAHAQQSPVVARAVSPGSGGGGGINEGVLYTCEDCGRRFKDAPSRNRHQSEEHYPHVRGEGEEQDRDEGGHRH